MTRRARARSTALAAALAGLSLALCAGAALAQTPRAERPTYKLGEKWIRSDGTYELKRIDKDLYVFSSGPGNEIHLTRDLGVAKVVRGGQVELDIEPPAKLTWPLEVGKWGSAVGVLRSNPPKAINQFTGNVRVVWAVEAYEDIRGAAGTFKAFKVVQRIETSSSALSALGTLWDFTMWYAPEVRQFVEAQGNVAGLNWELAGVDKPAIASVDRPRAERPTYQVGDKWIRSDGTYTLTRIDKDVYVFSAGPGKETHLTKDLGVTKVVLDGKTVFDVVEPPRFGWPLEIGKWGSTRATWRSPLPRPVTSSESGAINAVWLVDAYEDVQTAAGVFRAVRITQRIESTSPVLQLGQFVLWYAPDVQRFVKAQGNLPGLNWELAGVDRPAAPPVIASPPAPPPPRPPTVAPSLVAPPAPAPPVVRTPPAITLLEPKPGTLLRGDQATLKIEVKGEGRLKSLVVRGRSGDKTFAPDAKVKAGEPWVVEATVPLAEGNNVVRLEAVDEFGSRSAETVTLTRQSLVALDLRGPPGAEVRVDGTRYTLDAQGALTLQLPPGTYQIDASKDGFTSTRETVTLAPGQSPMQRRLALAPLPPPPPAPTIVAPPADTEAPKIAINYPPPDTKIERESIVITGLVTDNVDVSRVQVVVNGVEVAQPRDIGVVGRGVPIRVPAALQPGDNLIEITAADKAGNVAQVVRTVTRLAPVTVAAPVVKVANRWAVVIGISDYEHKAIPKLRFAARDAEAMYQFLTTQGGYAKDHVLLLTDTSGQKPTLLNIKRALGDFLARRAAREDMVLIYFAGHGAPEVDVAGAEADGLSKYLVPRDGDPESLYTTALPMEEIQRIFSRIPSERVVMLLDTCYSGTAGGRTFARASVRASGLNDQFLERLTRSRGRVIITASGPNEVALELPQLGHGLFTYYVLEGLKGKADRNGDGLVTVSELYEYVEDQVDRAARLAGGKQRPLMKGEIEGTLPLSRARR